MPAPKISSKTGNATITPQGQTTNMQFGSNPNAQPKGRGSVTGLKK